MSHAKWHWPHPRLRFVGILALEDADLWSASPRTVDFFREGDPALRARALAEARAAL